MAERQGGTDGRQEVYPVAQAHGHTPNPEPRNPETQTGPKPRNRNPQPETQNLKFETRNPKSQMPCTKQVKAIYEGGVARSLIDDARQVIPRTTTPYTLHPAPYTLYPTPYTLHPTPQVSESAGYVGANMAASSATFTYT